MLTIKTEKIDFCIYRGDYPQLYFPDNATRIDRIVSSLQLIWLFAIPRFQFSSSEGRVAFEGEICEYISFDWLRISAALKYGLRVGRVEVKPIIPDSDLFSVYHEGKLVANLPKSIAFRWKSHIESGHSLAIDVLGDYEPRRYRGWSSVDRSIAVMRMYGMATPSIVAELNRIDTIR